MCVQLEGNDRIINSKIKVLSVVQRVGPTTLKAQTNGKLGCVPSLRELRDMVAITHRGRTPAMGAI